MRAFQLAALSLLLTPAPLFAWGGYYGHHAPAKSAPSAPDGQAPVENPGAGRINDVGTSGTSRGAVGFSAPPVGGTLTGSPAAAAGNESGFSTPIHSLADQTLSHPGTPSAAQPPATTGGQLGSLLGQLGASGSGPSALGGAGLGGALANGSCPANMHSASNGNGGQTCVPGPPTQ